MKKLSLLLLSSALVTGVYAQQNRISSVARLNSSDVQMSTGYLSQSQITPNQGVAARGTAAPFVTEDFSSGTATTLPTGWTTSITGGANSASWHWTKTAATGPFNIGTLNSTTASNGWMIFDSDSLGSLAGSSTPLNGYLTSPSYSCTGHSAVVLQFQQWFRRFNDSCFVDVSNNGGTTWTTFSVQPNNNMAFNTDLPSNPTTTRINITSVAGNQANVKIRFHYQGLEAGGSFNWLIDDVSLADLDAVDLSLSTSAFLMNGPDPDYAALSAFSSIPLSLVDSMYPFTILANEGAAAQSNITVNAKLFKGAAQVYNQSVTYPAIPSSGMDSLIQFPDAPGYKPTSTGAYVGTFSVNQTGDAIATNNVDTFRFSVTDTIYTTYGTTLSSQFYLHRPSTHAAGEASFFSGSRFDIPVGMSDTVSSISVALGSGSTAGVTLVGQIYKLDVANTSWNFYEETVQKVVNSSEISTSSALRFANFRMPNVTILEEGTYAVVFSTVNAPATSTVTIYATTPLYGAPGLISFLGQSATAGNLGDQDFASSVGLATGSEQPRVIALNFGRFQKVGIKNIPGVTVGKIYPNPANNTVAVPVTTKETAAVNVTLTNTVGQAMATQQLGQFAANQTKNVTFSTAALANGVYFITVEANGARTTSRFVVAH